MQKYEDVAIFWDYENCHAAAGISGYETVSNIRSAALVFGSIKLFKAYVGLSEQNISPGATRLRSEFQTSGVSLIDCPRNGQKDVADKMMLVDMLTHAMDNAPPTTFILITNDQDFAYAISILRLRRYRVVVISPPGAHVSLKAQASICLDWNKDVMGTLLTPTEPSAPYTGHSHDTPYRKPNARDMSSPSPPATSRSRYMHDDRESADIPNIHARFMRGSPVVFPRKLDFDLFGDRESDFVLPTYSQKATKQVSIPVPKQSYAEDYVSSTSSENSSPRLGKAFIPISSPKQDHGFIDAETPPKPEVTPAAAPLEQSLPKDSTPELEAKDVLITQDPIAQPITDPVSVPKQSSPRGVSASPVVAQVSSPLNIPAEVEPVPQAMPLPVISAAPVLEPAPIASAPIPPPIVHAVSAPVAKTTSSLNNSTPLARTQTPAPAPAPVVPLPSTPTPKVVSAPPPSKNVASSSATPAINFERIAPIEYRVLVERLRHYRSTGNGRVVRTTLIAELLKLDSRILERVHQTKFKKYFTQAENVSIVVQGGTGGKGWIELHPSWY